MFSIRVLSNLASLTNLPNLAILAILLCIPLSLKAQDAPSGYLWTDLDGNSHYEALDLEPLDSKHSRTEPEPMAGWPKSIGWASNRPASGVCLADINEDGLLEILAGSSNGCFYVWDYTGTELPGWPKTGLDPIRAKPAVGDLDPAYPGLEIVLAGENHVLYAWHNDGTSVPGWPQEVGQTSNLRAPALFDIDQDGSLEIILAQSSRVIVFNHDGTVYPGWPQSAGCVATASVADVDNDGVVEICAVSYTSIYLWDKDGNPEPGWPKLDVVGAASYAQPVLADLDDDGDLEILHAYYDQWSVPSQNHVAIYHHDGTAFDNWPQLFPGPHTYLTPVVGDIDNDGDLEIFGGGHTFDLSAKHHTGETVAGWPVSIHTALECSPIVCDLDGDGCREVAVGENSWYTCYLCAFNGDGSTVEDWPILVNGPVMVNSPAVGDVDGDGDIEVAVLTASGTVHLWTIADVPYRGYLTEWGTFYHDNWNTGWMHPLAPQNLTYESSGNVITLTWDANAELDIAGYNVYKSAASGGPYARLNSSMITTTSYDDTSGTADNYYCVTAEVECHAESRLSNEVLCHLATCNDQPEGRLAAFSHPNPFSTSVTIAVDRTADRARMGVYSLAGQRIRELAVFGDHSPIVWDGRDDAGQCVASGVYLFRLSIGDEPVSVHKMVLMR
jgi:hypothetical protein